MIAAFLLLSFANCKKENAANPQSTATHIPIQSSTVGYVIKLTETVVDANSLNLPECTVVGIEAGSRGPLLLKNFIGTPTCPITFVNLGGKVVFQLADSYSYGICTRDCKYIKISGNGDPTIKYGIEVNGPHIGISIDHFTTNFEVENTEVHNTGFAGIMAKTEPSCDSATWRGNFTMQNVSLHDNYVHHTGGEGFYIGNSFYTAGHILDCGTVYPHEIVDCVIRSNRVEHTGCEGIQVGCAVAGCRINSNLVQYFGESPFTDHQDNGIQIGEGTGGVAYNNLVQYGPGHGIIVLGLGDNLVYNNIIRSSGNDGIFCDSRYSPGPSFKFINNTIVNSGKHGIELYSESVPYIVYNNAIINPGSQIYIHLLSDRVMLNSSTNFQTMDSTQAKVSTSKSTLYKQLIGSPLIDKGTDVTCYGIKFDFNNKPRPQNDVFDIGAYEFVPLVQ
jgi:hypothetical protein